MTIRGKNDKAQMEMNPHINEQSSLSDRRLKMIYDRYHTGKALIFDDLRYLWSKNPESFEIVARNIVESNTSKGLEITPNNLVNIGFEKNNTENTDKTESTKEQLNCTDDKSNLDTPTNSSKNVLETITSLKLMIDNMSENELMDMLKNLNKEFELKKQIKKMKDWDDTLIEKMVTYTGDEEKAFNILA